MGKNAFSKLSPTRSQAEAKRRIRTRQACIISPTLFSAQGTSDLSVVSV